MNEVSGVFMVRARRCKRCGGLLTSEEAIQDGYGHTCKTKMEYIRKAREPMQGQMTIEDFTYAAREKMEVYEKR